MVADLNTIRRSAVGINLGGIFSGRNSLFLVTALVLGVVVLLLVVIVGIAFRDSDTNANTLENFRELYGDRFVLTALRNTIGFTLVATFTSLFFAVPIAFLAERTTLPGRSFIFPLLTVTILIPGFFSAMGWLLMFHPRIGMMNKWAVEYIPFINSPPFNVATVTGMGFITGLGLSSLAVILLAGTVRALAPALEESVQLHGMGLRARLRPHRLPGDDAAADRGLDMPQRTFSFADRKIRNPIAVAEAFHRNRAEAITAVHGGQLEKWLAGDRHRLAAAETVIALRESNASGSNKLTADARFLECL